MASSDKRKAEEGLAEPSETAKRPRVDETEADAPAKLSLKLEILERAKRTLQQKKEFLAAAKKAQAAAAAAASTPAPRQEQAPAVAEPGAGRSQKPAVGTAEEEAPADEGAFFDPEIGHRGGRRMDQRRRGGLQFVEEGKFQKQAEISRLRREYGEGAARQLAARKAAEAAAAAADPSDPNLVPLGERPPREASPAPAPVPAVEWWDARLLTDKTSYGAAAEGEPSIREERITHLIEHPVLIDPPGEAPLPPPQPLMLTKKEKKKMRTQNRQAREKEKQELIRQGLLEPPPPKVKISNLSRVLGEEAAADPTAIETEVRRQMGERAAAHEDRNLARKLTPAEAREKKLRKLLGDPEADPTTSVSLYKVGSLARPQLKFKVSLNAQENHMTGVGLAVEGEFTLVVVEGPPKAQRRYEKLMLRRIQWNAEEEDEQEGMEEAEAPKAPNYCRLVWQGTVLKPSFRKFRVETLRNAAAAKAFLGQYNLSHYWDLAEASVPE
ncbi:PRP3 [Auxenochlorella protothecoides x Auxenochlorella symbiontica]